MAFTQTASLIACAASVTMARSGSIGGGIVERDRAAIAADHTQSSMSSLASRRGRTSSASISM
jgi:hypothetical protein